MTITLKDYRSCGTEEFDAAMSAEKRGMPVGELTDADLYIRYTKYEADLVTLSRAEGAYASGLRISTGQARDELLRELRRRHIDPADAKTFHPLPYVSKDEFEAAWKPRRFRGRDGHMLSPGNGARIFLTAAGRDADGLPRVIYADLLSGSGLKRELRTVIVTEAWGITEAEEWEMLARAAAEAVKASSGWLLGRRATIDGMRGALLSAMPED